jgi:RNA polymerase sigma factor (sigma-70 family)
MHHKITNLILAIAKGETHKMNELYSLTHRGVYAFVLPYIKDEYLSEDIMQETYIKIFNHIDSFKKDTNGLNWILTIAKNTALNMIKLRQKEVYGEEQNTIELTLSSEEQYIENTPTIQLAKKILPIDQLEIVLLHIVGGYKHREISKILNTPLGTILWKYRISIQALRKELEHENS